MPEVPEYVVNVKLAEILSRELGVDARAERLRGRRRPDIRCYYRGLIVGIEASYSRSDAERDAERRIEQGLADIAVALWLKKRYRDVAEVELEELIKRSRFDVKVFAPRDVMATLIPFIERGIEKKAEAVTGWFTDVDLPTLKTIVESAVEFLVREEDILKLVGEVKEVIRDFVKAMTALDTGRQILRKVYDVLYKLYGLSVAEAEDPEVVFGQAGLSILLSAVFYEHVRSKHPELKPLADYCRGYGYLEGLRRALEDLLRIDYRVAIEVALQILRLLPPSAEYRVRSLVELGAKIVSKPGLLRRDFAGRVYHEITGDIALRKGFATFYTEVPAAYLLASLAVKTLLDLDTKNVLGLGEAEARRIVDRIRSIKVGDLACGSGTLLTASYSILHRVVTLLKYYYDLEEVDLDVVGRALIEEGVYGIDALRYASQITAINLALIGPSTVSKENVYTIYLGYIPEKSQTWLGSLELLNNGNRVGGLLAWIEGGLEGAVERTTLEGVEGLFSIPKKFDLIIMNPPFTRATGRTERFGRGRGLFGFIADERVRRRLVEAYNRLRNRVKNELRVTATSSASMLPAHVREVLGRQELRPYLDIGQAGEGLLFLYLAYKYVGSDGVIAFVLPRGLLAGVSWFLGRVLLASKFHVKYVVVSSDPKRGYNFSEGASLSECLVVAKRVDRHREDEETVFVNLIRKPSTALEAIMLADEVASRLRERSFAVIEVGATCALAYRVKRSELLRYLDNWNRFVAVADVDMLKTIFQLLESGRIEVGVSSVKVPLTVFNSVISSIGIDRHQFHDHFERVSVRTPYPVIYGGEESVRKKMLVQPNAYASPKTDRAGSIFRARSGRVLVPDRIWWDTAHVIALYSETPVLSNIFYAVRLRVRPEVETLAEKAVALWLNTTWGLLTVLISRQETRGRWTSLKMSQWRMLPILDVNSLNNTTLKRLADAFDKHANKPLRRIPEQFNPANPDPARLEIDIDFLKALNPALDNKELRTGIIELYKHIHKALGQWIG